MVASKQDKKAVNYSRGMEETRCKNCESFRKPDHCTKVYGKIDPEYWCELFKKRNVV